MSFPESVDSAEGSSSPPLDSCKRLSSSDFCADGEGVSAMRSFDSRRFVSASSFSDSQGGWPQSVETGEEGPGNPRTAAGGGRPAGGPRSSQPPGALGGCGGQLAVRSPALSPHHSLPSSEAPRMHETYQEETILSARTPQQQQQLQLHRQNGEWQVLGKPHAPIPDKLIMPTQYQESVVEIPVVQHVEKVIEVPMIEYKDIYVEEPRLVKKEKIIYVPKYFIEEKIVEIPQVEERDVYYEVPSIQYVDKYVEVPSVVFEERVKHVPRYEIQENIIDVPFEQIVEKIVQVPVVQIKQVPREKIVEVPEVSVEYLDRPVQGEPRLVPREVSVEKIVTVKHIKEVERIERVPVTKYVEVPQYIEQPIQREKIVYVEKKIQK
eukprot:GHVT01010640.1.p1 GENE.GHVT01010640.1~~GHVT01010640.1.p1  ORF type:complete len:379 (-),score=88.44 GHVT01010640.1:609-1745(-)